MGSAVWFYASRSVFNFGLRGSDSKSKASGEQGVWGNSQLKAWRQHMCSQCESILLSFTGDGGTRVQLGAADVRELLLQSDY